MAKDDFFKNSTHYAAAFLVGPLAAPTPWSISFFPDVFILLLLGVEKVLFGIGIAGESPRKNTETAKSSNSTVSRETGAWRGEIQEPASLEGLSPVIPRSFKTWITWGGEAVGNQ